MKELKFWPLKPCEFCFLVEFDRSLCYNVEKCHLFNKDLSWFCLPCRDLTPFHPWICLILLALLRAVVTSTREYCYLLAVLIHAFYFYLWLLHLLQKHKMDHMALYLVPVTLKLTTDIYVSHITTDSISSLCFS